MCNFLMGLFFFDMLFYFVFGFIWFWFGGLCCDGKFDFDVIGFFGEVV